MSPFFAACGFYYSCNFKVVHHLRQSSSAVFSLCLPVSPLFISLRYLTQWCCWFRVFLECFFFFTEFLIFVPICQYLFPIPTFFLCADPPQVTSSRTGTPACWWLGSGATLEYLRSAPLRAGASTGQNLMAQPAASIGIHPVKALQL